MIFLPPAFRPSRFWLPDTRTGQMIFLFYVPEDSCS